MSGVIGGGVSSTGNPPGDDLPAAARETGENSHSSAESSGLGAILRGASVEWAHAGKGLPAIPRRLAERIKRGDIPSYQ